LGEFLLAYPFLRFVQSYVSKAFDFQRAFLWEWTVNWRFLGEDMFSSKQFTRALLVGHALTLLFFTFTRFIKYFLPEKLL
jgi:alpha-1,3-mannosyltransferase